jgi:hypothetical protein
VLEGKIQGNHKFLIAATALGGLKKLEGLSPTLCSNFVHCTLINAVVLEPLHVACFVNVTTGKPQGHDNSTSYTGLRHKNTILDAGHGFGFVSLLLGTANC